MSIDIRPCSIDIVESLCNKYHGYGSASKTCTYSFAVYEGGLPVAAYAWQPPPYGAARALAPNCPASVLSLSRMVAVPKSERVLKHVSKPLILQMKRLIDRGRWPVLVTYSDEGQGHTGYVYKCSGWTPTNRALVPYFEKDNKRISGYSNGKWRGEKTAGHTWIQRWEHRICEKGAEADWLSENGWVREFTGKLWKSGNPAARYVKKP